MLFIAASNEHHMLDFFYLDFTNDQLENYQLEHYQVDFTRKLSARFQQLVICQL